MDKLKYLDRIRCHDIIVVTDAVLTMLHQQHVCEVPFENLDIYFKRLFDMNIASVYQKVVDDARGGFCYELNLLFNWLLTELGFSSRIVSCRIFTEDGERGPAFDHMAVYVETEKKFLADVGFGDLFVTPLEIKRGVQTDGRNFFRIDPFSENEYLLSMSPDGTTFSKRYTFSLDLVCAADFDFLCLDKQTNPDSYFVKNIICTKPTKHGRVTIFNNKLVERDGESKVETAIHDEGELKVLLKNKFGLVVG